jgi:hypothetical protein
MMVVDDIGALVWDEKGSKEILYFFHWSKWSVTKGEVSENGNRLKII